MLSVAVNTPTRHERPPVGWLQTFAAAALRACGAAGAPGRVFVEVPCEPALPSQHGSEPADTSGEGRTTTALDDDAAGGGAVSEGAVGGAAQQMWDGAAEQMWEQASVQWVANETEEAASLFRRAVSLTRRLDLESDPPEGHPLLAVLHEDGTPSTESFRHVSRVKLRHDAEQLELLIRRRRPGLTHTAPALATPLVHSL